MPWKRRRCATTESRLPVAFQFPLPVTSRIAILGDGFAAGRSTRQFGLSDFAALQLWAPEALAAPLGTALSLADRKLRGLPSLTSLRTALVVLTDIAGDTLAEDSRHMLWQAFGVPIFEQLRGEHGRVIARECEVHDGLHMDPAAAVTEEFSGDLSGGLVNEQCECGAETPRLRNYFMVRRAATTLSASPSLTATGFILPAPLRTTVFRSASLLP
jgi:hypothetical protein